MANNCLDIAKKLRRDFLLIPLNVSLYYVSSSYNAISIFPIIIPLGLMIYATKRFLKNRRNAQRITLYAILLMTLALFIISPITGNGSPIIYYGPFILLSTVIGEYELFIIQVALFLGVMIFLASIYLMTETKKLLNSRKLNYVKLVAMLFLLIISVGYALVLPVPNWYNQNYQEKMNIKSSIGTIIISYRVAIPSTFDKNEHVHVGVSLSIDEIILNNPFVINVKLTGIKIEQLNASYSIIINHVEVYGVSLTVPGDLLESGISIRVSLTFEIITVLVPYYETQSIEIPISE